MIVEKELTRFRKALDKIDECYQELKKQRESGKGITRFGIGLVFGLCSVVILLAIIL